ncbi:hypothetical protein CLOP_g6720, partial [Closterium sp. NIES-67]
LLSLAFCLHPPSCPSPGELRQQLDAGSSRRGAAAAGGEQQQQEGQQPCFNFPAKYFLPETFPFLLLTAHYSAFLAFPVP